MKKKLLILLVPILLLASFGLSFFSNPQMRSLVVIPDGLSVTKDWTDRNDPIRSLRVVKRVLAYVEDRYVDPKRIQPEKMFKESLERVSDVVPEVRIAYPGPSKMLVFVGDQRKEFTTNLRTLFSVHSALLSSLKFIQSNLISEVSSRNLEVAAIEGLLTTLDPHSVYLSPEIYRGTKQETRGKFGGLGILIGMRDGKLTVISPLEGTPAFKKGIKAGDVITKIEGESTINMTLTEAVNRMRGQKGVPITITVAREGWDEARNITIVRDIIKIVSIESSHLGDGIGYVQIRAFHGNTVRDLSQHLDQIRKEFGKDLNGLVLDLRNNPGGLLDQAIAVSDKFLAGGPIVSTVVAGYRARNQENATRLGTEPDYPITILTNSGSASASEIVAGALQSRGRAVVIGRQTFGKGSVQSIFDLPDEAGLKLTIRQYLTPGDRSIQNVGISPDIRIYPAVVSDELIDIFENPRHIGEHQLEGHFQNPEERAPKKSSPEEADFSLPYFEERTAQEIRDEREEFLAETSDDKKREQYLSDFSISLAKQLLLKAPRPTRQGILEAAETVIPKNEKASLVRIQKALAEKKIDWSKSASLDKPIEKCKAPEVSFDVKPEKGKRIEAGSRITLTLKVENPGQCELNRFWAQTQSDNLLYTNREFLIGKVKPGKTITRSVKIKLPERSPSELVRLDLDFKEAREITPDPERVFFSVYSGKAPEFAYDYRVLEKAPKGQPNGLLQTGERVGLSFEIKNIGPVEAEEPIVSIKNLSGKDIHLISGRKELEALKPGNSASVDFEFEITRDYKEPRFEINFAVVDAKTGSFVQKKMEFDVYSVDSTVNIDRAYRAKKETKVYPQPNKDLPPLGRISASTRFTADATLGSFIRVPAGKNGFGWISVDDLEKTTSEKPAPLALQRKELRAPSFQIDPSDLIQKPMDELFAKITGKINDTDAIKDFYIRVNDRKVFYKNYRVNGDPNEKSFETLLPLEKGRNRILFTAHDEEGLLAQESIVLHRKEDPPAENPSIKAQIP